MLTGGYVPGYKLVRGRGGHRGWKSNTAVEALLRDHQVPDDAAYVPRKLASPAKIESWVKAAKPSPRVWLALSEHIKQPPVVPVVARDTDPRDAWTGGNVADEFEGETE